MSRRSKKADASLLVFLSFLNGCCFAVYRIRKGLRKEMMMMRRRWKEKMRLMFTQGQKEDKKKKKWRQKKGVRRIN